MKGFAAVDARDVVLIKTVSDTERAAKINWLVAYRGMMILDTYRDQYIAALFDTHALQSGIARIAQVEVTEIK